MAKLKFIRLMYRKLSHFEFRDLKLVIQTFVKENIHDVKKQKSSEKIIALVYGIYINSSVNWKKILYRQILDIKKLGILDLSDII